MVKLVKKSGVRARRNRELIKRLRDEKILKLVFSRKRESEQLHKERGIAISPLSRYFPQTSPTFDSSLTQFPITHFPDGRPMPEWEELSNWMKAQIISLAMEEYDIWKIDHHIHCNIALRCEQNELNILKYIRNRIRVELRNHPAINDTVDFVLAVEGSTARTWMNKKQSTKTKLHVHAYAFIPDGVDPKHVSDAFARGCGQGSGGRRIEPRALHSEPLEHRAGKHVSYMFKYENSRDRRLPEKRITKTLGAIQGGKLFWEGITGRWEGFDKMPPSLSRYGYQARRS